MQKRRQSPSPPAQPASAGGDTRFRSARHPTFGTISAKRAALEPRTGASSMATAEPCARIGIKPSVARTKGPSISMSAPVVESKRTVPKIALSQRRRNLLTPLIADQWQLALTKAHLMSKYPMIPMYIRQGAHARIPQIQKSYSPLNKISTEAQKNVFNEMIQAEFNKGRYIGPFSKEELEHEIGPFQSSPLSLVPKTGKPGKFHLIQNLSHPHTNLPTPSINTQLNSDDFPCTWGTFRTTCTLVRNLPPGAQAATRDIAEAYRIIPLHEDQWPGKQSQTSGTVGALYHRKNSVSKSGVMVH